MGGRFPDEGAGSLTRIVGKPNVYVDLTGLLEEEEEVSVGFVAGVFTELLDAELPSLAPDDFRA